MVNKERSGCVNNRFLCICAIWLTLLPWSSIGRPQDKPVKHEKLLIVGPKAFQSALAPFVAHKSELLPTEFVTLETAVTSSTGDDDAEKLKRYLFERWKSDWVRYVLLVGDCSIMPARYHAIYCGEAKWGNYYFVACDHYYADVAKQDGSFEDWNANKDGHHAQLFGELGRSENPKSPVNIDQIDYLPEIAVGRWPVQNVNQVGLLVGKTIRYEKHVLADDLPMVRRAGFVCCAGLADVRGTMDDWCHKCIVPPVARTLRTLPGFGRQALCQDIRGRCWRSSVRPTDAVSWYAVAATDGWSDVNRI
jgi:hypothetical protein